MLNPEVIISTLPSNTNRIFIGYSGGIDSHVLVHLCSSISKLCSKITAVHVNHGLQQQAAQWEEHCQSVCSSLNINFQCVRVNVQKVTGQSLEEAARDARYDTLKPLLAKHDVLLLAQHREDQLETVLLQLFRGAGVQGLAGMPPLIQFGQGEKCRPFLTVSKQAILHYAEKHELHWIEDPSNQCNDFDRNFLRNQILPQLKQRWPSIDKTVARSARLSANSYHLENKLARQLFTTLLHQPDQTLNISKLLELDQKEQNLVIRHWFSNKNLRMPSEKILHSIFNEVIAAKASSNPEIKGKSYSIRRYRNKLYCLIDKGNRMIPSTIEWSTDTEQLELENNGILILVEASKGISKTLWNHAKISVSYRTGEERISLPGRTGHHSLKNLFQEQAIPPWERSNIPLIYINDKLAFIADLWISSEFYSLGDCYRLNWLGGLTK